MYIPNVHIVGEELPPEWNNKCESINHWAIRGKEKFLFMWPVLRSIPDRQPKSFFVNHSDDNGMMTIITYRMGIRQHH